MHQYIFTALKICNIVLFSYLHGDSVYPFGIMWTTRDIAKFKKYTNIKSRYDYAYALISAIALKRYIGTSMTLRYEERVTPGRVKVALVFTVAYALTITVTSNYQRLDCLLNRLFRHKSKKTSKLHVTDLCDSNQPVTGGFPSQRAGNAEDVSIWWRHHVWWFLLH